MRGALFSQNVTICFFSLELEMIRLKFSAVLLAVFFTSSAWADGCMFNWHHYGDTQIQASLNKSIGNEVTNDFCPYSEVYSIIVTTDSFALGRGCVGYASAGLRKKNSSRMLVKRISTVRHNDQCNGSEDAQKLAISAAHDAVKDIMFNIKSHVKAAKELN